MDYLLKASGIVVILFLFYYTFLRNETFFKSIRSYFLIGLLIVVSIPLVEIPIYIDQVTSQINFENYGEIASTQFVESQSFDWIQLLTFVYLLGVLVFSFKFLSTANLLAPGSRLHPQSPWLRSEPHFGHRPLQFSSHKGCKGNAITTCSWIPC